LDDVEDQ